MFAPPMNFVNVAVVGASGYSGRELIRILMRHPGVNLVCVTSRQYADKTIGEVYPRFRGGRFFAMKFTAADAGAIAGFRGDGRFSGIASRPCA